MTNLRFTADHHAVLRLNIRPVESGIIPDHFSNGWKTHSARPDLSKRAQLTPLYSFYQHTLSPIKARSLPIRLFFQSGRERDWSTLWRERAFSGLKYISDILRLEIRSVRSDRGGRIKFSRCVSDTSLFIIQPPSSAYDKPTPCRRPLCLPLIIPRYVIWLLNNTFKHKNGHVGPIFIKTNRDIRWSKLIFKIIYFLNGTQHYLCLFCF